MENIKNSISSQNFDSCWTMLISEFGINGSTANVTEFDRDGNIIWQITDLSIPLDSERLPNGNTLITLHGEEKVIEYNKLGQKLWIEPGLALPTDAERLPGNHTLISNFRNGLVLEVAENGTTVWQMTDLHKPLDVERLPNGNTLIAEGEIWPYGRVLEVDRDGNEVLNISNLDGPTDVERLYSCSNGYTTLVTEHPQDHGARITEYDMNGNIIWQKTGLAHPQESERLGNGNTLVVETGKAGPNRVIELDPDGKIIWKTEFDLQYPVDVEILFNPSLPINPSPSIGTENVSINPRLSVEVHDPDKDVMDVSFYNAIDDTLIGTDINVPSGETASVRWNDLSFLTMYSWYAIVNDGEYETKSNTWCFTTADYPPLPTIEITNPKEGFFYFQDEPLFSLGNNTIVYGPTTLKIKILKTSIAQVDRVEIIINDKLEKTFETKDYNYDYEWSPTLCGQYKIKATVYDNVGQNFSDSIVLFKWRFHPIFILGTFLILIGIVSQL
jgi:outer membrane protein assembly factor BamB